MQTNSLDFLKLIPPVIPRSSVFKMEGFHVWCPCLIRGDDGLFYLFFSRWPRELGFMAWCTHSEIAYAVSDQIEGPFIFQNVVLPARGAGFWDGHVTHNTCVMKYNGKYYLYYTGNHGLENWQADQPVSDYKTIGEDLDNPWWIHRNHQRIGVAVADHPSGPWLRFDHPLIDTGPATGQRLIATPCVSPRPEGGFLMVYKTLLPGDGIFGGGVVHYPATADHPLGPFTRYEKQKIDKQKIFHQHFDFHIDDHVEWYQNDRWYSIVKDHDAPYLLGRGRCLMLMESPDGLNWSISTHSLVKDFSIDWDDGAHQELARLEMPKVYLENGRPVALMLACLAENDEDPQAHSFDLVIPLKQEEQRQPLRANHHPDR